MTQVSANFETGTNGNTVSTGDTGSATAWEGVTIGASAALIYDTAHVYNTLAAKVSTGASSVSCYAEWTTAAGTLTDHYGRIYLYWTANPTVDCRVVNAFDSSDVGAWGIVIGQAGGSFPGQVRLLKVGSATVATTTATISLNQWIRIEWHTVNSATVGTLELKLYNTPDSTTATETISGSALNNGANTKRWRFGMATAGANTGPFWMDNIITGATSYPGPVTTSNDIMLPMGMLGTGRV